MQTAGAKKSRTLKKNHGDSQSLIVHDAITQALKGHDLTVC